jgi:lipoyl(octanoyl) transferase
MSFPLQITDLGTQPYGPVLEKQKQMVEDRKSDSIPDSLILVEHEPVYSMGRNADESNVLFSREQLDRAGITVVPTGRGGDVTYHGPGQLVCSSVSCRNSG